MKLLDKWNSIDKNNSTEVLKFYFGNSVAFRNYPCRKFRLGVKLSTPLGEKYYEYNKITNIILQYDVIHTPNKTQISQCKSEILLDNFIEN